ncbi:MAG: histidinol-phosphate transaminase [Kiritimatiellaeota bacterium]|nr:histidinol-phosphate transaminase [Kiritimatiellota bacterium]
MKTAKWLNPAVADLRPYEPGRPIEEVARQYGLDPASVCKLASNENPLGTSPKARRRLLQVLDDTYRYPDGGAYYLRRKLAGLLDAAPEQLIFGNGSNEILEFVGHCFLGPGRSLVASAHAFVIYKLIGQMFGADVIEVPTRGLGHDLTAMRNAVRSDTAVVFVCNPNNPTGTLLREDEVRLFMDDLPDDVLVVFDEAYYELCLDQMPDTLRYVRAGRSCLVLRTFSKAYGLAGLRIGYGVGPTEIVAALEKPRQPFNTNRLAQEAAMAALDDEEFVRATRDVIRKGRDDLERACRAMGLEFERTYTNFMLIRVGDGAAVTERLTRRGVIVRPMAGYGLPEYIRVSFGRPDENEKLIQALRQVLGR